MANGVHVALPLELEPSSTDTPIDLTTAIGEATAKAVMASCGALVDFWTAGAMTSATRELNGERIAKMYMLMLKAPDGVDFPAIARREGKRVMHTWHDTAFRARYGVDVPEVWLDEHISHLLEILSKIAANERTLNASVDPEISL